MSYAESIHTGKGNWHYQQWAKQEGKSMFAHLLKPYQVPLFEAAKKAAETGTPLRLVINRRPRRYPTYAEVMEMERVAPKAPDPMRFVYDQVAATLLDLKTLKTPAAELSEFQRFALLFSANLMKYEGGKFVSVCPVAIVDRGDGGYLIGSHPDH